MSHLICYYETTCKHFRSGSFATGNIGRILPSTLPFKNLCDTLAHVNRSYANNYSTTTAECRVVTLCKLLVTCRYMQKARSTYNARMQLFYTNNPCMA